jgi:hypothetical protein
MAKSKPWSQADIDRISERNKAALNQPVTDTPVLPVKGKKGTKTPKPLGVEKQFIEGVLKNIGIPFVKELRFSSTRMFRFDYAIVSQKIGIEYEGIMSFKSRHTTKTGYTDDATKYNLATVEGWRVLRYTALNYGSIIDDLSAMGFDFF